MRDYGKVSPQFWVGRTGRALRGDSEAQLVALYLMTSPHANMIGVFHCPIAYIAHETGVTLEGALKALQRLWQMDFCTYDEDLEMVFVHEFAAHQVGDALDPKDLRWKGVKNELAKLPKGKCWQSFRARYAVPYNLPIDGQIQSPIEAPSKPLQSQKQKQEQKKNKETCASDESRVTDLPAKKAERERVTAELFSEFWTAYPRKRAKDEALKAFARRKPDRELLAAMLAALAKQSASEDWQRDEGKFIPYPATWINGGRWLDDDQARVADDRFAGAI